MSKFCYNVGIGMYWDKQSAIISVLKASGWGVGLGGVSPRPYRREVWGLIVSQLRNLLAVCSLQRMTRALQYLWKAH